MSFATLTFLSRMQFAWSTATKDVLDIAALPASKAEDGCWFEVVIEICVPSSIEHICFLK